MAAASAEIDAVRISRWPSERLLRVFVALAAIGMWALIAVTIVGAIYALMIAVFFFFAHIAFIYHLRGNAVRLGPEQFGQLHRRVEELSMRVGLTQVPEAYLVQAGGSLNAMATKFLGRNFIVLYSDLVEACGENDDARDFIIAHELGHVHAGHLRLRWLLLPGLMFPFLGNAYSRACEYTCDRYGFAACGERDSALDGLCILAAGGEAGPKVNRQALVAQSESLDTAWMTIARWLTTHPPIAHRIAELAPSLSTRPLMTAGARLGALAVLALLVIVPAAASIGFVQNLWPQIEEAIQAGNATATPATIDAEPAPAFSAIDTENRRVIESGILSLAEAAEAHRAETGAPPEQVSELYKIWTFANPGVMEPRDPHDGQRYGYHVEDGEFVIWSAGPNPDDARDDLYYSSAEQP